MRYFPLLIRHNMLKSGLDVRFRRNLPAAGVLLIACLCGARAVANPSGATVSQGSASFAGQGSQLTIHTSDRAFINWQSFNIGQGETTTFVLPSSSSVVWNQINDPNPSQILGTLNANGYVILQNQSGFYVGGQAAINVHGLIMTTAPAFTPDFSSGGPWDFSAPPPSARIVNYGQINSGLGGSIFLIANDIENDGSITAPGGNIGLYAGKQVLVSERPNGLGLSAQVTLPQGSVDNSGRLIADAGTIAVHAQVVNQGGLVQANSIREVNGTIELVAGDSLNLGPQSVISAKGDTSGTSAGGSVTLQSGGSYQDSPTSTIDVSGGVQCGNGGQIEISASQFGGISSLIDGRAAPGSQAGRLTIDPPNIVLVSGSGDSAPANGTVNVGDPPSAGSPDTLTLDVDTFNTLISQNMLSQINLQASQDIEVSTLWSLPDGQPNASLTLQAGRNITLDNGAAIQTGQNWTVNLNAGGAFVPTVAQPAPASGTYGIYLNGNSYIQTQNGDINLTAMNEVQIATSTAVENVGNSGIRTLVGGNISVTTTYGDVNTGSNPQGYQYQTTAPFYTVSPGVGGISTAAGGNVTITAGGNVFSFLPAVGYGDYSNAQIAQDGGTGAFGPEPGNVSITALGGGVFGHYVLANGTGNITAQNGDVGSFTGNPFALSLIAGTWNVNAPNGTIYLQEVRNPNGIFNNLQVSGLHHPASPGQFFFNYSPTAEVDLTAVGVYLNGENVPRPFQQANQPQIPILYPPQLEINAGSGGVVLQNSLTLFPSPDANLSIVTTGGGNFTSLSSTANDIPQLFMSDSGQTQWNGANATFSTADHGTLNIADDTPVNINISGSMENLTLITTKQTQINVTGDMINCGFSGQNVKAGDTTSIKVTGQIFNPSAYSFVFLNAAIPGIPAGDLPVGGVNSWSEIFNLALDPTALANYTVPAGTLPSALAGDAFSAAGVFTTTPNSINANPGFIYDASTGRLGFVGNLTTATTAAGIQTTPLQQALTEPLVVLRYGPDGFPIVDASGHFVTDPVNWVPTTAIQTLAQESVNTVPLGSGQLGYRVGGPGNFDVTADSISLGNSYGILSCGVFDPQGGFSRYQNLAGVTPSGATVNVTITGDLDMLTSTIAALGGGAVNVTSLTGAMDLGSQDLFGTQRQVGFGIFTSGAGDVNVTAQGDIDVDGSRIAAYDGGNITVESTDGNVNAGAGGATITGVGVSFINPQTGGAGFYVEDVFGSGIVANTLVDPGSVPGSASQPGNITVITPKGDINADLGGIVQQALNGNVAAGPTINLTAGSPGFAGNINLGDSGVIGGTVNLTANGDITGLVVSRQNSSIQAAQNADVTVLSGGTANVSASGTISGTIIAVGGVNTGGSGTVTATLLSQNVVVGTSAATSTLGTTAAASSAATAASAQANDSAQQQVASTTQDDDPFKKKGKGPLLARRVGRVTVILPRG
jgi:filamentous hemagglutinin family protein